MMVNVLPEGEEAVGTKPEKKPLRTPLVLRGWQGSAKEDCVTVWFFGKKENSIAVPTAAVMLFGVYVRPFSPTATWMVVPVCALAVAAAAARTPIADE